LFGDNVGVVKNLVVSGNVIGGNSVGGIVGTHGAGMVENCVFIGSVSGNAYVGGVVGRAMIDGTVQNCYSTGNVSGYFIVGGVVGLVSTPYNQNLTVKNCYSTSSVSGGVYIGGVVGYLGGSYTTGKVENCVALNKSLTRSSGSETDFGRVLGYNEYNELTISNNYGRSDMTLPKNITVSSSAIGIHGANVAATQWNNPTWWQNTAKFPADAWDFSNVGNGRLPTLRSITGTQNPTVQN
jgi:hypothetical protein